MGITARILEKDPRNIGLVAAVFRRALIGLGMASCLSLTMDAGPTAWGRLAVDLAAVIDARTPQDDYSAFTV